ncbi:MAG: SpoVG family protein [Candidatus Delongbacteria bacterium]|nr:SpoVG family protein [Candidatus Delongbacteria bacterium]MDD4205550.1 SpoVG family protein [Candidatus Delongbacteria bacterium]MDY0018296.1 SpoVG family protein [Candidatus Delongbacteria bacterium]
MEITEIRVNLRDEEKLKAFVHVTFDNAFIIRGLKIIKGKDGLFVCMPSRQLPDGTYKDIAHPIVDDFRIKLEKEILDKYHEELSNQVDGTSSEKKETEE